MAIEEYVVGEPVRIKGFFFNDVAETQPVDPSVVGLTVQDPVGGDIVYASPDNDAVGQFSQVVVPPIPGDWNYRWETTGPTCVVQGMFTIYDRNV